MRLQLVPRRSRSPALWWDLDDRTWANPVLHFLRFRTNSVPLSCEPPIPPIAPLGPHCPHLPAAQSWLPPPWSDGMGGAPSLPINCTLAMDPRPHSNEIFLLGIWTFIENIFASLAHGSQFELSISYTSDTIRKKCLHACLYPKPESRQQLLEELIIPCHQMLYIKIPP